VYQIVAISEFIATQFGNTLASSDDITAGKLAESTLVISMFGSLWTLLAVALLYLYWRDRDASKKETEDKVKVEVAIDSDTLEGRVELFMNYLTESFNPVFLQERWSWQSLKESVENNHAWYQVQKTLCFVFIPNRIPLSEQILVMEDNSERIVESIHLASALNQLFFVVALFFDLNVCTWLLKALALYYHPNFLILVPCGRRIMPGLYYSPYLSREEIYL
jgi:hypothetical protein